MTNATWLSGPSTATPATWVDQKGIAQIDPLAFSMADEAGRKLLIDQASQLEAEFAKSSPPGPPTLNSAAFDASASAGRANELLGATDELIAAHLLFVAVLEDLRAELGGSRPGLHRETKS